VLEYIYSLNAGEVIRITTNGTKLTERHAKLLGGHLKILVVSLNAASKETYNRDMKHGDFERTLANLKAFLSALNDEDRRKINLHLVAHTGNFREIPDFVRLAYDLNVTSVGIGNYLIGIKEHLPYSLLNVQVEYNAMVDLALKLGNDLGIWVSARKFFSEKERPRSECTSPFDEVFICPNGDAVPCCYSGSYVIGNVFEAGFENVWFGSEYRKLREARHLSACRSCVPFIPFDDFCAHFSGDFKKSDEFKEVEQRFTTNREPEVEQLD